MKIFDLPFSEEIAIGYGRFTLPPEHPFFPAARCHDLQYDELIAGTSRKTLKQIDREFLRNCLRIAAAQNWFRSTSGALDYTIQAWVCYRLVRLWSRTVRRNLDEWRPGDAKKA